MTLFRAKRSIFLPMQKYILREYKCLSRESAGQAINERKEGICYFRLILQLLLELHYRLQYFCFPKLIEAESSKGKGR